MTDKPETSDKRQLSVEELEELIAIKKTEDPYIEVKLGSTGLLNALLEAMQTENGVHAESLITILASLGGFSCQMALREEAINSNKNADVEVFTIVKANDGKKYFFGDALNKPLVEDAYSLWSLSAGMAKHLGATSLLDINELFEYVSKSVGNESFGEPRVPEKHNASDLPINYVRDIWPKVFPSVKECCDQPSQWPAVFGFALQQAMEQGKEILEPSMAVTIIMESAVPMSNIDPYELGID